MHCPPDDTRSLECIEIFLYNFILKKTSVHISIPIGLLVALYNHAHYRQRNVDPLYMWRIFSPVVLYNDLGSLECSAINSESRKKNQIKKEGFC
jgi:hypothetical protein